MGYFQLLKTNYLPFKILLHTPSILVSSNVREAGGELRFLALYNEVLI